MDPHVATDPEPRARLVIGSLGGDRGPGPATLAALAAAGWRPAEAALAVLPELASDPSAVTALLQAAGDPRCGAVLLVGPPVAGEAFRIQMRAENRESAREDAARLDPTGPGVRRVGAPVAEMLQALAEAGLPARAVSDPGDPAANALLYRLLAALEDLPGAAAAGLIQPPADLPPEERARGLRAAAEAMARRIRPPALSAA